MNNYLLIFQNSAQAMFFIPLKTESAWFAAWQFGNYNIAFITLAAFVGSTLGMIFNYWLGYYVSRYREELPVWNEALYVRISDYFRRNLYLLMAFPPLFFFEVIPGIGLYAVVNGMFRVPPARAIAALAASRALYYAYYLSQ